MGTDFAKFLKSSLLFTLLIAAAVLLLNQIYIRFVLNKTVIHRTTSEYYGYIKEVPDREIGYAIFGDSHAQYSINPRLLPDSFNFGSRGYVNAYYKLKNMLDTDRVKVRNIFLEIDQNILSSYVSGSSRILSDPLDTVRYIPWSEMKKINNGSALKLWLNTYFPSLGKGTDFSVLLRQPPLIEIYRGWEKHDGNYASSTQAKKESDLKENLKYFQGQEQIDKTIFDYFQKTVILAKQNNIGIIFIKYPLSKEYALMLEKNGIDRQSYYDRIFKDIDRITGGNYIALDYYDLFFSHPEYFNDCSHLNSLGSEILTNRIIRDLAAKDNVKKNKAL